MSIERQTPLSPADASARKTVESSDRAATKWRKAMKRARVPLGLVFTFVFVALAHPTGRSLLLGLPLVVAGLWLRGYASGYLNKRAQLAMTGPYAYTRNPLYLGSFLLAAGFTVVGARWPLALGIGALFFVVYATTILNEERYLRSKFPEFEDFVRAVPRFFPRLIPARLGQEAGSFSWALYLKHKEYNAPVGAALLYAALAARCLLG